MVVPGAMETRTADEIASMDADELREYVKNLQSQSQQSTSGLGPSTGGGLIAGSGQTIHRSQIGIYNCFHCSMKVVHYIFTSTPGVFRIHFWTNPKTQVF